MTEENDDGTNLVRVQAQVMKRDDSTGGWIPMGTGGLSYVSVYERIIPPNLTHEYSIHGKRMSDESNVLSCGIKKDFEYNKVMPTFHHWRSGDYRYGLTFSTAADGRAFDSGVRLAVEYLREGLNDITFPLPIASDVEDVFEPVILPMQDSCSSSATTACSYSSSGNSWQYCTTASLSTPNNVCYRTVNTPITTSDCHRPSYLITNTLYTSAADTSPSSTKSNPNPIVSPASVSHPSCSHSRIGFVPKVPPRSPNNGSDKGMQEERKTDFGEGYTKPHTSIPNSIGRRDSITLIKNRQQDKIIENEKQVEFEMISAKEPIKDKKLKCRFCNEEFAEEFNKRGSCQDAPPDRVERAIEKLTCLPCAQTMQYHCMKDAEGGILNNPCECSNVIDESCSRRWLGLTLLSLFVPCLWFYPPLKGCHQCGVMCHLCGGKHEAS